MIATVISHELRKYTDTGQFPPHPAGHESPLGLDSCPSESSDVCNALAAFAQVVATQLDVFGAFVNLSDGRTQRLVAGNWRRTSSNTDTLRLARSEADRETWLWLARRSIGQAPGPLLANGAFAVDLVHHDRTADLPCVSEAPHLRHYAAAPLTTKLGIKIGTLFILDNSKGRDGVSADDLEFLVSVANKCMSQLESTRQIYLRQRVDRICGSLGSFIQYRSLFSKVHEKRPSLGSWGKHRSSTACNGLAMANQNNDALTRATPGPHTSTSSSQQPENSHMSNECSKSNGSPPKRPSETTYQSVFRRAAESLGEALDVDGVLFVNGVVNLKGSYSSTAEPDQGFRADAARKPRSRSADLTLQRRPSTNGKSPPRPCKSQQRRQRSESPGERIFASTDCQKKNLTRHPGESLGFWSRDSYGEPFAKEPSDTAFGLDHVDEGFLQLLLDRYPGGNIWYIEEDHKPFTFSGEELRAAHPRDDFMQLCRAFPEARQLIFAPLMDPVSLKLLAGCFAWTKQPSPIFTPDSDIRPLRGFLHAVEAEISRIDTVAAVKQQEAFVSAVSHELRTPLHGILGAVELFGETQLDSFQQGLAESIRSCGTTLHDTLSSVLSYAQINQFERRRKRPEACGQNQFSSEICKKSDRTSYGLLSTTDIATLCEETVEVTAGGHVYNNPNSMDDVVVTMDIQWRENWRFLTEPGALRRVMSNIIGNALKYTKKGFVEVSLHVEEGQSFEKPSKPNNAANRDQSESPCSPIVSPKTIWNRNEVLEDSVSPVKDDVKHVVFTVTDSGKGMSRDFLEKHLFVPFTQEDSGMASQGVGLGMSIVKSLVALLDGKIHVRSQPRKGSSITVSIPMVEGSLCNSSPTITPADRAISLLRKKQPKVAVLGLPSMIKDSLNMYLRDWFQAIVQDPEEEACEPDILIVEQTDQDITEVTKLQCDAGKMALLGIGMSPSLRRISGEFDHGFRVQKTACRPIGPNKLAKSLLACLEDPLSNPLSSKSIHFQSTFPPMERMEVDPPSPDPYDAPSPTKRPRYCGNLAQGNGNQQHPTSLLTQIPQLKPSSSPPVLLPPDGRKRDSQYDSPISTPTTATRPGSMMAMAVEEQRQEQSSSARPRLLLVDDNDVNLMLLGKIMRKHGFVNYEMARNGEQAVEAFERARGQGAAFDIIFMDMMMPVLNGFAATRAIRAIESQQQQQQQHCSPSAPPANTAAAALLLPATSSSSSPSEPAPLPSHSSCHCTAAPRASPASAATAFVVALTALSSRSEEEDAHAAGADVVLSKPFLQGRVVEIVQGWLGAFREDNAEYVEKKGEGGRDEGWRSGGER
ncbi:hypothetical protein IWX46DRAFT_401769 [Phyllosticta citricarpa]|uniref:Uncharacterized protein n=1 Tax=Phyllosticta citricarpa TaxID=55181 RepID=A0ABR1L5J3_9PEZI